MVTKYTNSIYLLSKTYLLYGFCKYKTFIIYTFNECKEMSFFVNMLKHQKSNPI